MMSINDYLIEHEEFDWRNILKDWAWLLPTELTLWLMNRFGDLFFFAPDGTVQWLDVGRGCLTTLARDREEFSQRIDRDGNADDWLMIPLVDELVAAGVLLQHGECYTYLIPPILGGEYSVENTRVVPIPEHFGVYASYHQQLRDVPDGTKVTVKVVD